jgi:hypothetical protein
MTGITTKFTLIIGGGTRVDPSEIFRTKRGREELKSMSQFSADLGISSKRDNTK